MTVIIIILSEEQSGIFLKSIFEQMYLPVQWEFANRISILYSVWLIANCTPKYASCDNCILVFSSTYIPYRRIKSFCNITMSALTNGYKIQDKLKMKNVTITHQESLKNVQFAFNRKVLLHNWY